MQTFRFKKRIAEVLLLTLALPSYIILFVIGWCFRHKIKKLSDAENILNNSEFFVDSDDKTEEGYRAA